MTEQDKRISVADIPDEMIRRIRDQFERNEQIRTLRVRMNLLQRQGNYLQALQIGKSIDEMFHRTVSTYISEAERQYDNISLKKAGLPKQDILHVLHLTVTMFMAIDILDSCLMDIDDTIHRTDKTLSYDMFDDIRELSKMVKDSLSFFGRETSFLDSPSWGDITDNMYRMMQNKAKAIIAKANAGKKETEVS